MPRLILIPDDLEERLRETDGFTPADDSVITEVVNLLNSSRDTQSDRADKHDADNRALGALLRGDRFFTHQYDGDCSGDGDGTDFDSIGW